MENVFQIPDCMSNRHIKQKTINRKGHQMGSRMRHTKNDNQHTRSYVLITKTTLNIKCETEICSFFFITKQHNYQRLFAFFTRFYFKTTNDLYDDNCNERESYVVKFIKYTYEISRGNSEH